MKFFTTSRMLLLVFLVGLLNILFAEKITVEGGLGWDGSFFGAWAKDFYNEVFIKKTTLYFTQRILPSAIVHYGLRLLGLPLENQTVIRGFEILNLSLLLISCYVWKLIGEELRLKERGKWLGFCALFINFPILKMGFYYPVMTDITAFTLGILTLYCYLHRCSWGILTLVLIGAFSWPAMPIMGLLLFIFPRDVMLKTSAAKSYIYMVVPVIMTLIVLFGVIIIHFIKRYSYVHPAILPVSNLSIILLLTYVLFAFLYLFKDISLSFTDLLKVIHIRRIIISLVIWFLLKFTYAYFSNGITGNRWGYFFERNISLGIQKPLIWGVAHAVFYGPIFIVTFFLWPYFCRIIRAYGAGIAFVVTVAVFLSISSESRHIINFFPVFVAFTVKAVDSLDWKLSHYWLIAVLSLLYSKVWLSMNAAGAFIGTKAASLEFPDQYYNMSHGPWMSNQMYVLQGSIVLATTILLYLLLFHQPTNASKSSCGGF